MTVAAVHVLVSTDHDPAVIGPALTYGGVGLCGELIAMLGLVSYLSECSIQ